MTLWDWARRSWDRPGVAEACLALQNDHLQCVPLVLWALWRWEDTGGPGETASESAAALCRAMDDIVIAPLRAARRVAVPEDRERLLANELKAEHELFNQLEALPVGDARHWARSAGDLLSMISALWGRPVGPFAFNDLLTALSVPEPADVR